MAQIFGTTQAYENDRSGETRLDGTETRVFRKYGLYQDLLNSAPAKGSKYNDWYVLSSSVTPDVGGMGELVITCVPWQISTSGGTPTSEHLEVTYVETNQQLAFHKNFPGVDDASLMSTWRKFLASPEKVQLELKYCPDLSNEDSTKALDDDLKSWATLFNKGIADFVSYLPVVSRVRTYKCDPSKDTSGVGLKDTPPLVPSGFSEGAWLKTADNSIQDIGSSRWTRTESWTWAAEWPDLLYSDAQT